MIINLKLDFRTWFKAAQVGSSIYGDLLKPNDIDIAISVKLPLLRFKKVFVFRLGKFNFIVFHGLKLEKYLNEFDMDIIRGVYKSLITGKIHHSYYSARSLTTNTICQLTRHDSLFNAYDPATNEERLINRAKKYRDKTPDGWECIALNSEIEKAIL